MSSSNANIDGIFLDIGLGAEIVPFDRRVMRLLVQHALADLDHRKTIAKLACVAKGLPDFAQYSGVIMWTDVTHVLFWEELIPEVRHYWDMYYGSACGFMYQAYSVHRELSRDDKEAQRSLQEVASALRMDARELLSSKERFTTTHLIVSNDTLLLLFRALADHRDARGLAFFMNTVSFFWLRDHSNEVACTIWFLSHADGSYVFDMDAARALTSDVRTRLGCDVAFAVACLFGNERISKDRKQQLWASPSFDI